MSKNNSGDLFDFNDLFSSGGNGGGSDPNDSLPPTDLGGLSRLLGEENCPLIPMIMATLMLPRPLGMTWSNDDAITKFLKFRGYRIVTLVNDMDEEIHVAVKADSDSIPDLQNSNVLDVFNSEIQDAIISILIKVLDKNKNE